MKKIRLTIEWPGGCAENVWADVLKSAIEEFDSSGITQVTKIELITEFGDTTPLTLAPDADPFLTPHEVRKNRRLRDHP